MEEEEEEERKASKAGDFRLTLTDETKHRQLLGLHLTRWSLIVSVVTALVILLAGAFAVVALTPLKNALPGYPSTSEQRAMLRNTLAIDSLEHVVTRWEFYASNLRRVFEGEDPVQIDSIVRNFAADTSGLAEKAALLRADSLVRSAVRSGERFSLGTPRDLSMDGKHFFTPVKGVISEPYDQATHPYVGISAPEGSMVMAVLDGTVIDASKSDTYGYTVMVQHDDDIISVYKYLQKALKEPGERITAGTPIAMLGSSGSQKGDNLRLELWYKGMPADPQQYINF